MAKLNHQKRHRPRPMATRRRRTVLQRAEERRSQRDLERWRRSPLARRSGPSIRPDRDAVGSSIFGAVHSSPERHPMPQEHAAAWTLPFRPSTRRSAARCASSPIGASPRSPTSSNGRASSRTTSSGRRPTSACWACRTRRRSAAPASTRWPTRSPSRSCRRVSGSVGIIVSAHTSLGCNPIWMAGTEEQKEKFLRPMASGEVIGAYGLTEPGAGSDSRGTRTRARRDGDDWVLNGGKRFITNAGVAGTYIVTAVTDREEESGKISAFIVEADAPGFSIGRMEEKMGLHASNTGELIFEDCRVPAENMLGPEGEGDTPVPQDPRRRSDRHRVDGARPGPGRVRGGRRPTRRSGSSSAGRSAPSRAWPSRSPTWPPPSTPPD